MPCAARCRGGERLPTPIALDRSHLANQTNDPCTPTPADMTGELARRARFMLVSDLDWTMVGWYGRLPTTPQTRKSARRPRGEHRTPRRAAAAALPPTLPPSAACPTDWHAHPSHLRTPVPQVDHGDFNHAALRAFNRLWVSAYAPDSLLVFSTGRSPPLFHELAVGGAGCGAVALNVDTCSGNRKSKVWLATVWLADDKSSLPSPSRPHSLAGGRRVLLPSHRHLAPHPWPAGRGAAAGA